MKKREKALREYLYTTPMILQYPNAFTVTQPGHNLVQHGMPQIQSAMPVAPTNGFVAQVGVPFGAPMGAPAASDPSAAPAPAATTTANTAVIPPQMVPMTYPATMDYSAYPDLRSAMASFFPRRSRRSQRHRDRTRSHHRSRRRSPSPSDESSMTESMSTSYGSPSSYDSAEYPRNNNYRRHRGASQRERDPYHHRSGSARNPLPRPPKDILASTPFRPLLSQLPSTQYSTWGPASGGPQPPPATVPMPQPQPAPPPQQQPRRDRGMGIFRRRRDTRFAMPSLNAAAQSFNPAMSAMHMPTPDMQNAPGRTPGPAATPVLPPVVPGSAQMPMRMPEADHHQQQQQQQQQPPVIPHGMGPGSPNMMSMPSPAQPGSTPYVGGGGGLMTPAVVPGAMPSAGGPGMPMPNMSSAQAMPVSIGASPAVRPMSMPTASGGPMGMGMPSPGGMGMPLPGGGPGGVGVGGVVPTLRFNGYGEYSGLLYHSPHRVMYEDELYPTALHLFEALKFLPHRPDLADQIRLCDHVEEVTAISASFAENTRRDWGNVALTTMDEVLYLKFRQHSDLRGLLLGTFPADLIYVESGDAFWGDGAGAGMNELGKSLMRVREQLRAQSGM